MAISPHATLAPELDDLRRQFETMAQEAGALCDGLSDAQFNWRPADDRWTVAQCVDHLNVTAREYLPLIDEGIADAIRRGIYGEGPFRYNWFSRAFVRFLEPPPRMRTKAPKVFMPAPERPRLEAMNAFRAYQVQYIDRLRQSNGLDLARATVRSHAARWLRIPLGSGFMLMAAHERRHLWQVRELLARPDFPR